jgi:predicted TIM-barrel fold metal-dependent hydrolase
MGDTPFIDLRLANPILLYDLINDPLVKNAKIILTHGGYPWIEEAGFLVNTYPNVYLDLSETIPFISIGVEEKLLNLFEMAPTNKIMYGSDGYNIPELHWFSSIQTKNALGRALNKLLKNEYIDEAWAKEIGEQILSNNAKLIYNL